MNNMRKWVVFLSAVFLATLAVPGLAALQKNYSLNISPASSLGGSSIKVTAAFKNLSPTGNSTWNSLTLSVNPSGSTGLTIVGVDKPASGTVTFNSSTVSISNISPVNPGDPPYVVTLYVSSPPCPRTVDATWSAVVWSGSNFSGDTFTLVAPSSSTAMHVGCDGTLTCQGSPDIANIPFQ